MAKPLPGLAGRLQELGSDYQTLTETARLEGLSTALPAVGIILIGVIILALILATCLLPHGPERGTRPPPLGNNRALQGLPGPGLSLQ